MTASRSSSSAAGAGRAGRSRLDRPLSLPPSRVPPSSVSSWECCSSTPRCCWCSSSRCSPATSASSSTSSACTAGPGEAAARPPWAAARAALGRAGEANGCPWRRRWTTSSSWLLWPSPSPSAPCLSQFLHIWMKPFPEEKSGTSKPLGFCRSIRLSTPGSLPSLGRLC